MTAALPILDDIDARPGSVASLLRTVIGLYLRRLGGWIAAADLVRLLGALGVDGPQARTGIARLRQKGLLIAERRDAAGYRVNPAALPMLERGDRRILSRPSMGEDDPWCLVSYSISEARRDVRGRLRRRLQWIGAGTVAPGLWICPGYLADEAAQILDDLGARGEATLFRVAQPEVNGPLSGAVARWWDLDALAAAHLEFLAQTSGGSDTPASEQAESFACYVQLVDRWRPIPYTDPGLPAALLPTDWPGVQSAETFARVSARHEPGAWEYVQSVQRASCTAAP